jgi:molybdenum-dependent DNA-binding transcriptional regulator ModE
MIENRRSVISISVMTPYILQVLTRFGLAPSIAKIRDRHGLITGAISNGAFYEIERTRVHPFSDGCSRLFNGNRTASGRNCGVLGKRRGRAMDRVSSMQSFVKVVENGGFAAAARQLHLSPSLVTTHIKSLEDRLGVRLLDRNTRKVSLTEVGQAYYERCLQILAEIDEADQIAESSQMKPKGVLRLNVAQAMPPVITPALVEFVTRYPDASVRVTVTSRMVDLVEDGFDLAIRLTQAHTSVIVRHLRSYRMVVCGAPSYAPGAPRTSGGFGHSQLYAVLRFIVGKGLALRG